MGKGLHKSLQIYLSKFRSPNPNPQSSAAASTTTTTTSWLLSACKHPKTPSFAVDRDQPNAYDGGNTAAAAATLSDVDRFLFENFSSLYTNRDDDDDGADCSSPPPKHADPPLEVRASQRFFVSPGTSNSLMEEARLSAATSSLSTTTAETMPTPPSDVGLVVPGDSVAVMTFSKDPYEDFRRSMQEMVEARHVDSCQPLDWDFMEELLFCYLELNDKNVHKYILGAFTDLTVSFRRRFPGGRLRKIPSTRRRRRRKKGRAVERGEDVVVA